MRTITCTKWGTKYDGYEQRLYNVVKDWCDRFYCITDNPTNSYDIQLPDKWPDGRFFTHQKLYQFNEDLVGLEGDEFIALDLDILIHNPLTPLWDIDMDKPWILRGYWQDANVTKKNFGEGTGTYLNSSLLRWNRGQCKPIFNHIDNNTEYLFFTCCGIDNYVMKHQHDIVTDTGFFNVLPRGTAYSWYKGNSFPDDMETKKLREDYMLCLFNSTGTDKCDEMMEEIEELKGIW